MILLARSPEKYPELLQRLQFASEALSQVHHVQVGSESRIVSEVIPRVVGILVDHDGIGVPEPSIDVREIRIRNAEVPSVKPETRGASSSETVHVISAKLAREAAVSPRLIHVVTPSAAVMANPFSVVVYVRSIGVSRAIVETRRIRVAAALIRRASLLRPTLWRRSFRPRRRRCV
jgi:hypothetical protein